MVRSIFCVIFLLLDSCARAAGAEEGLVAHWDCNQGEGTMLKDVSGNGNDGRIRNADWTKMADGCALNFKGSQSYVDFGDNRNLKRAGDVTVLAWIKVADPEFPSDRTNYHVIDCSSYRHSGFRLLVVGSGKLAYESDQEGNPQGAHSQRAIEAGGFYHVAFAKKGDTVSFFLDGMSDIQFKVSDPLIGTVPFKISTEEQSFHGLIDDVKMYSRALSPGEVAAEFARGAAEHGKDASWVGKILLKPYFYFADGKAIVEANFSGILPLQEGETIAVELAGRGGAAVDAKRVEAVPGAGRMDFDFNLSKLSAGDYDIRALTRDASGRSRAQASVAFRHPPAPAQSLSPDQKKVASLPAVFKPPKYDLEVGRSGGFAVRIGEKTFSFVSSFSYPNAGFNKLCFRAAEGEPGWTVTVRPNPPRDKSCVIHARSAHYTIARSIRGYSNRIAIQDRITNATAEDIGIVFSHYLRAEAGAFPVSYLGGVRKAGRVKSIHNPTVFIGGQGVGLGLAALDDVAVVQGEVFREGDRAGLSDGMFGLAPGASYTVEWAIYPTASEDYYDFLNALRRDLGLNGKKLEGGIAGAHSWEILPDELVKRLGAKFLYPSLMDRIPDDSISVEGAEFVNHPKLMENIRNSFARHQQRYPEAKMVLHIAHSLYTTKDPDQFKDSKVIDENGKPVVWGGGDDFYYTGNYFSKENLDRGWRWWIFYPTLENSFFKAMLQAVDALRDDLKGHAIYADGLQVGYGSPYTYDRWDGHSVQIDPQTFTVKRKFGCVQLLAQDALIAYAKHIAAKGGYLMVDSGPGTLTFARTAPAAAYPIESEEDAAVCKTHLTPFPMGYGYPRSRDHRGVYLDALAKLKHGCLYYYYYGQVDHEFILTHMYPITIEEIHAGWVKGREKIVTIRSGVYGWDGDPHLHQVHFTDGRGVLVPRRFLATVDSGGARTELMLNENESAIVAKIPVRLDAAKPVNVIVRQYDAQGIELVLNGKGRAKLVVCNGVFPVRSRTVYRVDTDSPQTIAADQGGTLSVPLRLDGGAHLRIEPPSVIGDR